MLGRDGGRYERRDEEMAMAFDGVYDAAYDAVIFASGSFRNTGTIRNKIA